MRTVHEVRVRHENELLALPGVVGVADVTDAGRSVIQVLVSDATIVQRALIPKQIDGYPVDIILAGEIDAQN